MTESRIASLESLVARQREMLRQAREALDEYLCEDRIATDHGNGVGGPVVRMAEAALTAIDTHLAAMDAAALKEQQP